MDIFGLVEVPIWTVLVLLAMTLLYIYGSYPMRTWKHLGVPGPPSLPFIGNFHQFYSAKAGFRASVSRWQKEYGNIIGIHYFRKPCLVISDVEVLKDVFVKEYTTYHDRFFLADGNFFPDTIRKGVFFQRGPDWKRIRRILTATFTSGKLKNLTHHINKTAGRLADKLVDHAKMETQPNAKAIFGAFSLDVIAGSAFSLEINSQNDTNTEFFKKVRALFHPTPGVKIATAVAGLFPFMASILKSAGISIFNPKAVDYFKEHLNRLISERKDISESAKSHDTLQHLIDAEVEDSSTIVGEKRLSKEEVVSQGVSFLIAGYDTTSSALQFTAYFLAQNKDVQEKVVTEIQSVVGDAEDITYDHCQQLSYLESVINETLRLFPPVHWLKRETNKPTFLKSYMIPANTGILIPVYNIGRDPDVYKDPDTFNPDRFLQSEKGCAAAGTTTSFLPFGFGPKQCIGMRMAMMEMKIALVHVLRKIRFENVTPKTLEFEDYAGILVPKQKMTLAVTL